MKASESADVLISIPAEIFVCCLHGKCNKGGYVATQTQQSDLQMIQNQPPCFENQSRGTAQQHSFDHCNDQQYFESLTMRADRVLYESKELIRQTSGLQVQTTALLKKMEQRTGARFHAEFHERPDLVKVNLHSALTWVVDAALQVTGSDMANLQLVDPLSGDLYIAAQYGFSRPFLDFFGHVHEGSAACGTAFKRRDRIIVEDVTQSPIFWRTNALEVLLDARVRAVQSSPLISRSGAILGVVSTHWSSPYCLSHHEKLQLDFLARTFANCLECSNFV